MARRLTAVLLIVFAVGQMPFAYIGLTVMAGAVQSGPGYFYLLYLGFAGPEDLVGKDYLGPLPELHRSDRRGPVTRDWRAA